jgi:hypothetical protein
VCADVQGDTLGIAVDPPYGTAAAELRPDGVLRVCRTTQPCHVAMGAQPTCTATSHSVGSSSGTDGSLCLRPEPRAGRSEQPASDAEPRSPNARSLDPDINATLARCHENWLQPEALGNRSPTPEPRWR